MTATRWEVRRGAYYDSVVLMQLQRGLLTLAGVVDSGVVMATPRPIESCWLPMLSCPIRWTPMQMIC
jgi:hypothetical protein